MITGNQLLDWLKEQTPATLKCPVGFVGHFGEFKGLETLPEVVEARRDAEQRFGRLKVIKVETPNLGPEPE